MHTPASARRLFNERVAVLSAAISACYYPFIQMPAYIMTEVLNVVLLLMTLLLFVRFIDSPSIGKGIMLGVLYGVTALCKGTLVGFILFFALSVLVSLTCNVSKRVGYLAVILVAIGVTMMPWIMRNYRLYQAFVPVTIVSGDLLYKGNSSVTSGGSGGMHTRGVDFIEPTDIPSQYNEYERDRFLKRKAIAFIRQNPALCARLAVDKFWNMWRPYHAHTSYASKVVMCVSYLPMVAIALIGMACSLRSWRRLLLFYLLAGYYVAVHMVLLGVIRSSYNVHKYIYAMPYCLQFRPLTNNTTRSSSCQTQEKARTRKTSLSKARLDICSG